MSFIIRNTTGSTIELVDLGFTIGIPAAQVQDVTTVADVAGSLGGTYFLLDSPSTKYYVWYDVDNGSTDPGSTGSADTGGRTSIEVDIATGDLAATVATNTRSAIGALADFSTGGAGSTVTITNANVGVATPAKDSTAAATGFTFAVPSTVGDGTADLNNEDPSDVQASQDLLDEIAQGDIVVLDPSDGTTALSAADSLTVIQVHNEPHFRSGQGQNIWATITSDAGSTTADNPTDTLTVTGGTGITTSITGDILTITGGDGADLASVLASRTTSQAIPNGSFGTMNWDVTEFENDTAVISHDPVTNNSRLTISETGVYQVFFALTLDPPTSTTQFSAQVIKNGVATAITGSERMMNEDNEANDLSNVFLASLTAGDYIELQIQANQNSAVMESSSNFGAMRARGSKGDAGPAGSGSTITIEDENIAVTNTPHSIINFTGAGVTATDAGAGQVDVTIPISGLQNVVEDLTPQLGGNLDPNGFEIAASGTNKVLLRTTAGTGDIELLSGSDVQLVAAAGMQIELTATQIRFDGPLVTFPGTNDDLILTPDGTGNLVLDGINWPQADGTAGQILETDGAGQLSFIPSNRKPLVEILLVVNDKTTPSAQDTAKKSLIESFGYTVVLLEATDSQADFDSAVATSSAAYISEEITSNQLNGRLRDACIGIVNDEDALHDEFGFSTAFANYTDDEIDITDITHYITEVFSLGLLTITTSPQPLHTLAGTIAPGAQTLAEQPATANRTLVVLDPGADITITAGSDTAQGRRVYLPWGGSAFDINTLTDDGKTLMRRAIEWASGLGCPKTAGKSLNAVGEITDVTCVADVAGSLGGTFFNIDAIGTAYYVWYDVDNLSVDPAPAGRTAIEVDISSGASASSVAGSTRTAMNAVGDFSVFRTGALLNIANNIKGAVPDTTDGSSPTGFTIATVQQGEPTDNAIPRFDGLNGKLQNSSHVIADDGTLTLFGDIVIQKFTVQTTDATQTVIGSISITEDTSMSFNIRGHGRENATGDTLSVEIKGAIRNEGGVTALVGEPWRITFNDTGAATWDVDVVADDTSDELDIRVTGEAAHTIDWKLRVETIEE